TNSARAELRPSACAEERRSQVGEFAEMRAALHLPDVAADSVCDLGVAGIVSGGEHDSSDSNPGARPWLKSNHDVAPALLKAKVAREHLAPSPARPCLLKDFSAFGRVYDCEMRADDAADESPSCPTPKDDECECEEATQLKLPRTNS